MWQLYHRTLKLQAKLPCNLLIMAWFIEQHIFFAKFWQWTTNCYCCWVLWCGIDWDGLAPGHTSSVTLCHCLVCISSHYLASIQWNLAMCQHCIHVTFYTKFTFPFNLLCASKLLIPIIWHNFQLNLHGSMMRKKGIKWMFAVVTEAHDKDMMDLL